MTSGNRNLGDFKEIRSELMFSIGSSRKILIFLSFAALFAKVVLRLSFSPVILFFIFAITILFFTVYEKLLRLSQTENQLYNTYLGIMINEIILLTIIIHYLGGVEWVGGIFYVFILLMGSFILPFKKVWILAPFTILCYTTLVLLEYFSVIPHKLIFPVDPHNYQSAPYVGVQVFAISIVLIFVVKIAGDVSVIFRKKREEVKEEGRKAVKAYQESEEARKILQIEVKARTEELEILVNKQEEIVAKRTEELQEKIKELESFHRLTVGRELKMIELKEKIKELERGPKKSNKTSPP